MKTKICLKCNGTGRVPDHSAIGAQMQRRRKQAGVGLREMARKTGYSAGFLHDLEIGRRNWLPGHIEKYDDVIGSSSNGERAASEARKAVSKMSRPQKQKLFEKGMEIINGKGN